MNASVSLLTRRIQTLEFERRRRTRTALCCALLGHAIFGLAGGWFRLPVRHRDTPPGLGFEGRTHLIDLSPADDVARDQEELARQRREGGALQVHAVSPEVWLRTDEIAGRISRAEFAAPADTRRPDLPPVLELGENWNAPARSSEQALSEQFQVLKMVRPDYPPAAIRAGIDGLVELEVEVDEHGAVGEVRVRRSPPRGTTLEQASVEAMRQWVFHPLQRGGRAVPFTVIVPFRYRFADRRI
jgi:TonB family protein